MATLIPARPSIAPPTPQALERSEPSYLDSNPPPKLNWASSDDDDSDSDDSDSEVESPDARSPGEREAEKLRVLEAAGVLVLGTKKVQEETGLVVEGGGGKRRRKAPMRPMRKAVEAEVPREEEVAGPEETVEMREERMEDAYDVSFPLRTLGKGGLMV